MLVAVLALCTAPGARSDPAADALRQRAQAEVPAGLSVEQRRRHYMDKTGAARELGDVVLHERLLREAADSLPDPRWPNNLAILATEAGRLDEAITFYDLAIARASSDSDRVFFMANRLAVPISRTAGSMLKDAVDLRDRVRLTLRPLGPGVQRVTALRALSGTHSAEAEALSRLGQRPESMEQRRTAEAVAKQALDEVLAMKLVDRRVPWHTAEQWAKALRNLAGALISAGAHAQGEEVLDKLTVAARQHALSPMFEAYAHSLVADLRMRRAEYADAERRIRAAQQVLDRLNYHPTHPFQSQRRRTLMAAQWAQGNHDAAWKELQQHDALLQGDTEARSRARFPFERGLVLLGTRRHAQAAVEFEAAAQANRVELGADHYNTLQASALQAAALWLTDEPSKREQAAALFERVVPALMDPRHADFHDDAYMRKAIRTIVFDAYLDAMASRGGDAASAAFGVADRQLAGSTSQAMTDAALRAAAAGQPELAALVRREQDSRAQVRGLRDLLHGRDESRDAQDQSSVERRDAVELDNVRRLLSTAEAQLQEAQAELSRTFPAFDRLLRPGLAKPDDVRAGLTAGEAMLLALPTERALLLWLVVPGQATRFVRVAVPKQELVDKVRRLREGLDFAKGPRPTFDTALAHDLYRKVLAPVAAALPEGTHVVVATSAPLSALPFAALTTEPGAGATSWAIQRWAWSQIPSVAPWVAVRQLPRVSQASEPLLAWADPTFARAPAQAGHAAQRAGAAVLQPLPETRAEVIAIASALKASPDRDLRLGERATRDSVLEASRSGELARKRVVIFATHGLTAGDLPALKQPALALAPPRGTDDAAAGLLGLDDILGLRLAADWVVLSACNTAASDGNADEALSGLARGFLHAGTRSLLVTHWDVETESAKQLTIATFEHHAAHAQAGKAASLRQAMLDVMAMPRYAHPAYWAAFLLVGDGAR